MIKNSFRISLLVLPLALIVSCSTNKAEENTGVTEITPTVTVTEVKAVDYSDRIRTTGRVSFNNEYKMSFKTGGVVEAVYVKEGQRVKKGQILATLKLNEIEAKTNLAEIAVQKAQRDNDRTESLYADSVATFEQLENAESQLQNAKQNLYAAEFNQDLSKIIAPSNGIIQKIMIHENEITGAGNPVLIFGGEDQGKVFVTNVSDVDVVKLQLGDKALLHFDAWPDSVFNAEIIEIGGMASPATGTFEVKIQINDNNNQLKPGFIGNAMITSSIVNHWIEIPIESLVQANKKNGFVYRVENEIAIKQEVHISKILNEKLMISSGLSANDQIIIKGFRTLTGDSILVKSTH